MKPNRSRRIAVWFGLIAPLACLLATARAQAGPASDTNSPAVKQRALISVLQRDAAPEDKAMACKQLAIYGTKEAIPALAALLSDEALASWARIALEAIPDPAADAALRQAMDRLHGRLLVGVLNSIGVRRDAKAVGGLAGELKAPDADVAAAAAAALGRIGGVKGAWTLQAALARATPTVRPAIAEGCIVCAERFFAEGQSTRAVQIYDAIRSASVPKQQVLEATRGAILARQSAGLPLLFEQLRADDKAVFGMGLRIARELPGSAVTEALAAELGRCDPGRQILLLLALADRTDAAVLPAVLKAAGAGSQGLRLAAIGALERLGNPAAVPVLLETAVNGDAEVATAALGALVRLADDAVDADVLARLPAATGQTRRVLLEVAAQRRLDAALPVMLLSAEDADAAVRRAAVQAIGELGHEPQVDDLVRLLAKAQNAKDRADLEVALIAISGREGKGCAARLLPLTRSSDSAQRTIGLHALASAGGPEALAAISAALQDTDEGVQDEAVRTLAAWPNNWPEDGGVAEPLLVLAKGGRTRANQLVGLRGYLQYVRGNKQLKADEKVARINEALPLLQRPEEKRLAMAAMDGVATAGALELLTTFVAEPDLADEACASIVKVAAQHLPDAAHEQRRKSLQTVVEKSPSAETKKKAEELLNGKG